MREIVYIYLWDCSLSLWDNLLSQELRSSFRATSFTDGLHGDVAAAADTLRRTALGAGG
jgi:hypothetical protein